MSTVVNIMCGHVVLFASIIGFMHAVWPINDKETTGRYKLTVIAITLVVDVIIIAVFELWVKQ